MSAAPQDSHVPCDVVIPCRDEAAALPALLAKLPAGFTPIVVDNGSRDGTADVARSLGARVVEEPRPGYGAAVHAGLEAATAGYVAVMDGDGSMDPADLVPMLSDVHEGRADLAVGRRRPVARGVWPWHARAGNTVVLWWLRRRIGMTLHDIAPMRVARREDLLVGPEELGIVWTLRRELAAHDVVQAHQQLVEQVRASGTNMELLRRAQASAR